MKILKWKIAEPPNFRIVPEKAGVYIISTMQEDDHQFEVKYIGQADNLHGRAAEHWSKHEKNDKLKAHIAEKYIMKFNYAEVESRSDRDGMVLYMSKIFDPPLNLNAPPDTDLVKCTVPGVRKYK